MKNKKPSTKELEIQKRENVQRLKASFERICSKYNREFSECETDIVDIAQMKIVKDVGFIHRLPDRHISGPSRRVVGSFDETIEIQQLISKLIRRIDRWYAHSIYDQISKPILYKDAPLIELNLTLTKQDRAAVALVDSQIDSDAARTLYSSMNTE